MEGLGDACLQLDAVLSSAEFQACVGDDFPSLPRLADAALGTGRNQREIMSGMTSEYSLENANDAGDTPEIVDVTNIEDEDHMNTSNLRIAAARTVDGTDIEAGDHTTTSLRNAGNPFEDQEVDSTQELPLATGAGRDVHVSDTNEPSHTSTLQTQNHQPECHDIPKCDGLFKSQGHNRAQWPIQKQVVHLLVEVTRLTAAHCGPGFRRHDRRGLRLHGSRLEIFDKGSILKVKSVIDVGRDLDDCSLLPGGKIMSIVFRRIPPGVDVDAGVWKNKQYVFEFDSKETAMLFYVELCNMQDLDA
jgi:hypothetical protein